MLPVRSLSTAGSTVQGEPATWREPEREGILYRQRLALETERALIGEPTPDEKAEREQQNKALLQVVKVGALELGREHVC